MRVNIFGVYPSAMYAIIFDIDQNTLAKTYEAPAYANAYTDIEQLLKRYGFTKKQNSLYFASTDKVNAVTCVLAAQDLAKTYNWFSASVKDIKMLRIEETSDLMPAIKNTQD